VSTFYNPEVIAGYRSYLMGKHAFLFAELKPLPSSFRVHWRVLNIDGFHYTLRFEPVSYKWSFHANSTQH
jgi:hypothetical protein